VEEINGHRVLVGKREGKRPFGRSRNEWLILKWSLKKQYVSV
jgi:hypothetical protein